MERKRTLLSQHRLTTAGVIIGRRIKAVERIRSWQLTAKHSKRFGLSLAMALGVLAEKDQHRPMETLVVRSQGSIHLDQVDHWPCALRALQRVAARERRQCKPCWFAADFAREISTLQTRSFRAFFHKPKLHRRRHFSCCHRKNARHFSVRSWLSRAQLSSPPDRIIAQNLRRGRGSQAAAALAVDIMVMSRQSASDGVAGVSKTSKLEQSPRERGVYYVVETIQWPDHVFSRPWRFPAPSSQMTGESSKTMVHQNPTNHQLLLRRYNYSAADWPGLRSCLEHVPLEEVIAGTERCKYSMECLGVPIS